MKKEADKIGNIVKAVVGSMVNEKQTDWEKVSLNWEKLVGEPFAKRSKPYRLSNNVLYVIASDSVTAFELSQRKKMPIIDKLKKEYQATSVLDIHIRVGDICQQ